MDKELNPDDSVRNEQFGAEENATEHSEEKREEKTVGEDIPDNSFASETATGQEEDGEVAGSDDKTELTDDSVVQEEDGEVAGSDDKRELTDASVVQEEDIEVAGSDDKTELTDASVVQEDADIPEKPVSSDDDEGEDDIADESYPEDETADNGIIVEGDIQEESVEQEEVIDAPEVSTEEAVSGDSVADDTKDHYKNITLPPVDYSGFGKQELVETLGLIIENRPVGEIRDDVERIKIQFYKTRKVETEEERKKFLEEGGNIEEFTPVFDEVEKQLKSHLENYRKKRSDQSRVQEGEKYENLKKKYEIIEKIKDLVNREESINKTFQEFRTLQNDWHSTGVVPQSALKDLWENYHHNVEVFYNYIKINKELRDLDLKKNLEAKITLCEKSEELLLEPSAVNAFRLLQDFHNQWREIGPVPNESKNEVWERFREATSKINKRHTDYFDKQKDEQRKNFEAKIAICEKVEEFNLLEMKGFKEFEDKSREVIELQKMWRTIGFAPKKHNTRIYYRFREACDAFFEKKRGFYAENKGVQMDNLQRKADLCIQAESLASSEEWKDVTETLIKLQKEWKEVGPVPRKQSDKLWKRFRKACDTFFERKSSHFADAGSSYEENLKVKSALITEIEGLDEVTDVKAAFERLKDIQRRWTETGFVPFNMKEEINKRYRDVLDKQFDRLKLNEEDKNILKYRSKLETVKANPNTARKIRTERDKFYTKIKQLESDITLWENNIGFFAKSAKAESMILEVEEKIENAKKMIRILEEKVKMIDKSGLDE